MKKKVISIILTASMICAPLTAFAERPDIELGSEYNNEFAFDIENSDVPLIERPSEMPDLPAMQKAAAHFDSISPYTGKLPEIPVDNSPIEISGGINSAGTALFSNSVAGTDTEHRLGVINGRDSFALQNQTGRYGFVGDNIGAEYIDPMTGNLIVTETDLVLPGVDGLDLRLERYYSLAEAELYTKTSGIKMNGKNFSMPQGTYVVTESVYNKETAETSTYQYPCATESEAKLRKEEIESRDTDGGNFIYSASYSKCSEGDEVYVPYYYTSEITATSYQRERYNLGAGWSWSFPSVQIIKDNYDDTAEIPKGLYYHDGKGGVMEVEYNGGDYSFANYVGGDITFEDYFDYDGSICTSGRIDYIVSDADGRKYYFGSRGELLTICDRFGNKITFNYTAKNFYGSRNCPIISSITDSVGRKIRFSYNEGGDYEDITLTVTSPLEQGEEITLSYEKKMIEVNRGGDTLSTEPVLTSFTNAIGEVTSYYPAIIDGSRKYANSVKFTFADKSLSSGFVANTSGNCNNLVYLLGNIIRPRSDTYYEYELTERNLGHSGISEAYRTTERGDYELTVSSDNKLNESHFKNRVRYKYTGDYTAYPRNCSASAVQDGKSVCTTREIHEKSSIRRDFYKHDGAVLLKYTSAAYDNPVGNALNINYEVTDYLQKRPVRTKITYSNGSHSYESYVQNGFETRQNKAYGRITLETQEVDYDTVIGSAREKYGTSYTYDAQTGFMTSKAWYRDLNTRCIERYKYNDQKRLSQITAADGTQTRYDYEYTSDGRVSKKTTTTVNGADSLVVEEIYTTATGYAYPTTVKKTAGGKTSQTAYTYNMLLGMVSSQTDNDGNTTYFEYDKLGRETRIVYPKYAAYSDFNEKDVDILPVENIRYVTVSRSDYAGITDEKLIAQEIKSTLRYYDVSQIDTEKPTDTELAVCSLYYIGDEVNYYMGTGELIEKNVIDNVGGVSEYLTTSYIYDTKNNIKTTIDPDGNQTKEYYDDLDRCVKIVDIFDNQHITEYNRDSIDAGFCAMSYFMASGETQKQNISEQKYDRMQRVVSEKAYDSYPDSFAEVQYTYDIAGNVTGITDAKGYTIQNSYDKLNRCIASENANGETVQNSYDIFGNIKKQMITAQNGEEHILYQREYDGEGRLISDTDNSVNSNTYTYNALGQLEQMQDKNGRLHNSEYNAAGVCDRNYIVDTDSELSDEQYQYLTPFGASMTIKTNASYNPETQKYSGSFSEVRDTSYSPTGKMLTDKSKYYYATGTENVFFQPQIGYTYDSMGNVTSATYSCIDDVNQRKYTLGAYWEYDKNRISRVQVTDGAKDSSDNANASYEFYADGKLKSVTYPPLSDGSVLKSVYTYDGLSRLKTLTNTKDATVLSEYSYEYDKNNNIVSVAETVVGVQKNTVFTYDKLNRIASVAGDKGADSYYEYDFRGNRKANFEQIDFLAEKSAAYQYDIYDDMTRATVDGDVTKAAYGINGSRFVKRENSDMPTYFIYDKDARLVAEAALMYVTIDSEQKVAVHPIRQYIWGPDRVLAQIDFLTGESYYYLYNGHGDVIQIVDTDGNIVNRYDYDVWGNFITKEETVHNPFTYFGQTYDENTGLYYLRARYYDPTTGRFTQQDPSEDGYNWYVYGNNNPVMYVDENGLRSQKEADRIIRNNTAYIISAAQEFGVNPSILAATIYAEQRLNVDWKDDVTDTIGGFYGINTSIGVAQVRMSTAKNLENLGYMPKILAKDGGWNIPGIGFVHGTETMARAKALEIPAISIMYAAADLAYIQDIWREAYPEIDGRTAIMATLYNIGEYGANGPHSKPQSTYFGDFAKENYYYMQKLLGLN